MAAVAAARIAARPLADNVDPDESERRRTALKAVLPLRLEPVPAASLAVAMRSLNLPADENVKFQAATEQGRVHLVWLEVFDSDAEDGDRITIESLGLTHTMQLTRKPVAVPVPLPSDGRIRITGIDEGLGGGVTLGVMTGGTRVRLPPLRVGETVVLPAVGGL
ncbi:MAG: hypothetical protein JO047_08540 [Alphaproteobacteria bacterium]|nr:hypothetical protein [Alphaproteobacteria bacterium]